MSPLDSALFAGLILFGTLTSLLSKVLYQLQGTGRDGLPHPFEKPWASTALMFLGMLLVLPYAVLERRLRRWYKRRMARRPRGGAAADALQQPLLGAPTDLGPPAEGTPARPPLKQLLKSFAMVAIPTALDLVATALMGIGLLSVTASVYQMMRGSEMVFTALYAVTLLKRRLTPRHWAGIGLSSVGLLLVGVASVLSGEDSGRNAGWAHGGWGMWGAKPASPLQGMMLILLAQAVQAAQVCLEDYLLSSVDMEPLHVVGVEGAWGCALMFAAVLPLVARLPGEEGRGVHEDSLDTWAMIRSSPSILAACSTLLLTNACYNVAGMYITDSLGSVARTVLESARTLFVWASNLALYYAPQLLAGERLGEPWTRASWLQAMGFALAVAGTALYTMANTQLEAQLNAAAAAKAHGEPMEVARRHLIKSTLGLHSVVWTAVVMKGSERHPVRQRWARATAQVLEAAGRHATGLPLHQDNGDLHAA